MIVAIARSFDRQKSARPQNNSKRKWLNYAEDYIAELKVTQADDLLNLDILYKAYQSMVKPLVSLATIQGFKADWSYQNNQN